MADEQVEQPEVEQAPEPTVEELQRDLTELRSREKMYKDTLSALGQPRQEQSREEPVQQVQQPVSDAALLEAIAKETGVDAANIGPWVPVIRSILRREAEPVLQTVLGLANKTVDLEARLTIDDWKDIESDAKKIMGDYRRRGAFIDPKDAADIARSRKVLTVGAGRAEEDVSAQRQRATAASNSSATAGGGTQTAGPKPHKNTSKPMTRAEIEKLPSAEREKALDAALENVRF